MSQLHKIDISALEKLYKLITIISRQLSKGVVFLHGDLGAGKTTFVQFFLKSVGYTGTVTSPSYGIVNEYSVLGRKTIMHADLYRIADPQELLYLDVDEWVEMADIIFIEWPERGGDYLPEPDLDIYLSLEENNRWMTIAVNNEKLKTDMLTNESLVSSLQTTL